jgi:hypothetical protein
MSCEPIGWCAVPGPYPVGPSGCFCGSGLSGACWCRGGHGVISLLPSASILVQEAVSNEPGGDGQPCSQRARAPSVPERTVHRSVYLCTDRFTGALHRYPSSGWRCLSRQQDLPLPVRHRAGPEPSRRSLRRAGPARFFTVNRCDYLVSLLEDVEECVSEVFGGWVGIEVQANLERVGPYNSGCGLCALLRESIKG